MAPFLTGPNTDAKGIGFRIMSMEEIQGPGDLPMLARVLKGIVHAPVEDNTGLSGKYDIEVKWTPENGTAIADSGGASATEPVVSIFAAFRLQLGLSLARTKVPIDMIVIDSVERPREN